MAKVHTKMFQWVRIDDTVGFRNSTTTMLVLRGGVLVSTPLKGLKVCNSFEPGSILLRGLSDMRHTDILELLCDSAVGTIVLVYHYASGRMRKPETSLIVKVRRDEWRDLYTLRTYKLSEVTGVRFELVKVEQLDIEPMEGQNEILKTGK